MADRRGSALEVRAAMRALLQRVSSAHVDIDNATVGRVGIGLLVFVCAVPGDDEDVAAKLAAKIAKLRIFQDDEGRMNRSVRDLSLIHI